MNPSPHATGSHRPRAELAPVVACVKWVDLNPGSDPRTGVPVHSRHGWGFSEADRSALELALQMAEALESPSALVCAGPPEAGRALESLGAVGADRTILVEHGASGQQPPDSVTTARVLADVLGPDGLDARSVLCGVHSLDRGSGAVPPLLAHHLGLAQALGLIALEPACSADESADRWFPAVRRLDGGRRERIRVPERAVVSVEGAVAVLRRSSLAGELAAGRSLEVTAAPPMQHAEHPEVLLPWKPPPRSIAAPSGADAFTRVVQLTGALDERTPPTIVELTPADAAQRILDQLHDWGYRGGPDTTSG